MADRLVKIASFWYVAEADLARAVLAAEEIPACLAGACALSWFWHWANADGGVKVLVFGSDAARALRVLSAHDADRPPEPWQWRTESEPEDETAEPPDDEPHGDPYAGDVVARRAWLAAVLGLCWFPPLILYAFWVLGNLDPEADPLSRTGARRRKAGVVLTAVGLLIYGTLLLAMLARVIWLALIASSV